MKGPVKISVIVPIYNVEDYLPFALESLREQTLRDVEFICVNDGSTDDSLKVLKEYASTDERFIVVDKKNGGVSSARNEGLRVATGKWIMFLDPDDYYNKNACERVWIESEEGLTDIIVFGTDIVPKQPKATPWHYYALDVPTRRFYEFSPWVLFGEPSAKPFIWHQAYSRELLQRTGARFDEELALGEDMAFLMNIYPHASRFSFIEDKLYNYRFVRKNSAMQVLRKDPMKKMNQHLALVDKVFAHWKENGFMEKYGTDLLDWALEFIVYDIEEAEADKKDKATLARAFHDLLKKYDLLTLTKKLSDKGQSYYSSLKAIKRG
ncbi:MAG: glycosyltransferase family 2 protein [Clostridia bacterium]|nr:glycosyltransferase family 2 protein [Clostridia bacterium]